jgi:lipid-A-disaccharide synthase
MEVEFVGHPLLDRLHPTLTKEEFLRTFYIEGKSPLISLLPGSRNSEVEQILPIMLESAKIIYKEFPNVQFLVLSSSNVDITTYHNLIRVSGLPILMLDSQHYNAIVNSDIALVASGTATLETAILNTPMLIVYKVSFLTWAYAKSIIKIPYIGLANVVAGKKVVPEFVQFGARPNLIAQEASSLLKDKEKYNKVKQELSQIKIHLGSAGASQRAAQTILRLI